MALLRSNKDTQAVAKPGEAGPPPRPAPTRRRRAQIGFLRGAGHLGVIGVATAIAAILGTQDVDAWVVGVVSASVALVLAWVLRRSLVA